MSPSYICSALLSPKYKSTLASSPLRFSAMFGCYIKTLRCDDDRSIRQGSASLSVMTNFSFDAAFRRVSFFESIQYDAFCCSLLSCLCSRSFESEHRANSTKLSEIRRLLNYPGCLCLLNMTAWFSFLRKLCRKSTGFITISQDLLELASFQSVFNLSVDYLLFLEIFERLKGGRDRSSTLLLFRELLASLRTAPAGLALGIKSSEGGSAEGRSFVVVSCLEATTIRLVLSDQMTFYWETVLVLSYWIYCLALWRLAVNLSTSLLDFKAYCYKPFVKSPFNCCQKALSMALRVDLSNILRAASSSFSFSAVSRRECFCSAVVVRVCRLFSSSAFKSPASQRDLCGARLIPLLCIFVIQ